MSKFLIIVITLPEFIDNEGKIIENLLKSGIDYVHIRKPESTEKQLSELIESISPKYRKQLKLHDHFSLAVKYQLGGIQINSRNNKVPTQELSVSRSCHTLTEIDENYNQYDYVTLSPIFDSISKTGYKSHFSLNDIKRNIKNKNVIALGGVGLKNIPELIKYGFHGAAMLGYVWNNPENFIKELKSKHIV
ncbi:MAG: thiamine phosphate synthase [Roseburia sp.]|nr:thiamine phosphate synthase [Roseburia sp.]